MSLQKIGLILLVLVVAYVGYCMLATPQPPPAGATKSTTALTQASTLADAEHMLRRPTLSAAYINTVLEQAHSPARGLGETLYQLSAEYQIDDAFALAFFHHESDYGKNGVARETHSLGNIRCTDGYDCDHTGGYRKYATWILGAEDWYDLIKKEYIDRRGLSTLSTIVPVYAPSEDNNDVRAYITNVQQDVLTYRREEATA
ncbi:hypothetical protein KDW_30490 [Dictyobacter vulcani]|uniref:Uncharacterized protein n=1 Tax=Dictyobacter vulcani TaxID=2607529 RepID=A0A5J4KRA6_9CHLR|nr:glucosaminidase domain-containing protein [Dictyobacter vulcani]GER88887.1 hypothetical protein KDW_30490 [Dictyobacter vulcani]